MLRLALVYDMDACRGPTGVTRHALAQIGNLRARPEIDLRLISGRISEPDGLAYWESLEGLKRRELPVSTRDALFFWRHCSWPPVDWWSGAVDWVYSPAEYRLPTRPSARRAVTSHDVLQDLEFRPKSHRARLETTFSQADLILSVSKFNTQKLLDAFPSCLERVVHVPNGADDLFYESPTDYERTRIRQEFGLPTDLPYLLSVANFQGRKNLGRMVRALSRIPEVVRGELGLVLIGTGDDSEKNAILKEVARLGPKAKVAMPGYRQEKGLRAAYAEATALVFPSLCESFGIPAVEAMAQGIPVVLSNTTALPEVGGEAGWYFDPENEDSLQAAVVEVLQKTGECARRVAIGKTIAETFRWQSSTDRLVNALQTFNGQPRQSPAGRHLSY